MRDEYKAILGKIRETRRQLIEVQRKADETLPKSQRTNPIEALNALDSAELAIIRAISQIE